MHIKQNGGTSLESAFEAFEYFKSLQDEAIPPQLRMLDSNSLSQKSKLISMNNMRCSLLSTRQTTNSENVSDSLDCSLIHDSMDSRNLKVNDKRSKLEYLDKLQPCRDEPSIEEGTRKSLLNNLFKKHESQVIRLQSSKFNLISFEENTLTIS